MRIAGAPITWGVCEAPAWGAQLAPERVLAELRAAGYGATEAGPDDFLASDPRALRDQLDGLELELAGVFVPVRLHDAASRTAARTQLLDVLDRLAPYPRAVACLAVLGERADYERGEVLDETQWRSVNAGLGELLDTAEAHGIACVLHPHVGTIVEQPEDIERVLLGTRIDLCLDTGHLLLGDSDPLELLRHASGRIGHVHLKDVDLDREAAWHDGVAPSYHASVEAGMYTALGYGGAHVGEVVDELVRVGYDGWLVIERDTVLPWDTLLSEDAARARVISAARDREWAEARIAAATRKQTEASR